jgi:hypothetical protein
MAQGEVSGLYQWFLRALDDTTSPYTNMPDEAVGIITGGDLSADPNRRKRGGIGGTESRRGGVGNWAGSITYYLTNTNADLAAYGFRSAYPRGSLTRQMLSGGTDEWGMVYRGAVMMTTRFRYAEGEGLVVTQGFRALHGEKKTVVAFEGLTEDEQDFEDYEFVGQIEGGEYGITAFEIDVNQNVIFRRPADTPSGYLELRDSQVIVLGPEDVNASVSCLRPVDLDTLGIFEDELPADLAAQLVGTNQAGDVTSFVFTDLQSGGPSFGFVDNTSVVEWGYQFEGSWQGCLTFTHTPAA